MKKFAILYMFLVVLAANVQAQTQFTQSLRTCEKYSQQGGIQHSGQYYNLLITLEKNKKKCTYKEKIYQSSGYQMLTCNFNMDQLGAIADSMDRFTNLYRSEIDKNKIFEAKLTSNGEIFENYLIKRELCQITQSKTK